MPGLDSRLGGLLYASLQVGDPKGGGHDGVQTLRVICVHPVASIMQKINAVSHS